jgi:alkylation response protein AidB-like acyl-CoA dehydrogenase
MDVTFSKVQQDIAKEARRFLEKECPIDYARAMFEDDLGFRQDVWSKMAEMDWMGIRIPEAYGGLDMGQIDLALVLEQMGRAVLPGPFFSTVMLASEAIIEAGSHSQRDYYLPKIAKGEIKGTLALYEEDGGADPGYIQMQTRPIADGFVLNGAKLFVLDAHVADFMIVAARTSNNTNLDRGVTLFIVDTETKGLSTTKLQGIDGTRKLCAVRFEDAPVKQTQILGELHGGWQPLSKVLQRAQVGLSAECVGGAQRAMEIAVAHAKIRHQFGKPLGAFQVIKHRCAQMFVEVESSRSLLFWASCLQDRGEPKEAALSASVAKAYCSESYTQVSRNVLQILGGTGFTWESDIHLYLKRAKFNEMAFGDPSFHREQVMKLITG